MEAATKWLLGADIARVEHAVVPTAALTTSGTGASNTGQTVTAGRRFVAFPVLAVGRITTTIPGRPLVPTRVDELPPPAGETPRTA